MNEPNIVILAAGSSSRMKRGTNTSVKVDLSLVNDAREKSKAMIGVGSNARPFLDYLLRSVEQAGYRKVVLVIGEQDAFIRDYYEVKNAAGQFPLLSVSFTTQGIPAGRTKPMGTADALFVALQSTTAWKGQWFTVCNSDNLYSVNVFKKLLDDTHANALIDYDRAALQLDQARIAQFAVITTDEEGFLTGIREKPSLQEIKNIEHGSARVGVSMNIFRLSYDMIVPVLQRTPVHPLRDEKELPVAVSMLAAAYPKSVWTIPVSEHVLDLTHQTDLPFVQEFLKKEYPQFH